MGSDITCEIHNGNQVQILAPNF